MLDLRAEKLTAEAAVAKGAFASGGRDAGADPGFREGLGVAFCRIRGDSWILGFMDAWIHGCMDSWMHGFMDFGISDFGIHGFVSKHLTECRQSFTAQTPILTGSTGAPEIRGYQVNIVPYWGHTATPCTMASPARNMLGVNFSCCS